MKYSSRRSLCLSRYEVVVLFWLLRELPSSSSLAQCLAHGRHSVTISWIKSKSLPLFKTNCSKYSVKGYSHCHLGIQSSKNSCFHSDKFTNRLENGYIEVHNLKSMKPLSTHPHIRWNKPFVWNLFTTIQLYNTIV